MRQHKSEEKQRRLAEDLVKEKTSEITKQNGIIRQAVQEHELTKKAHAQPWLNMTS